MEKRPLNGCLSVVSYMWCFLHCFDSRSFKTCINCLQRFFLEGREYSVGVKGATLVSWEVCWWTKKELDQCVIFPGWVSALMRKNLCLLISKYYLLELSEENPRWNWLTSDFPWLRMTLIDTGEWWLKMKAVVVISLVGIWPYLKYR